MELGAHVLAIKDMAGLLKPEVASKLSSLMSFTHARPLTLVPHL